MTRKDELLAGCKPREQTGWFTIRDLVNHFLTSKRHQCDLDEITSWTFVDYHTSCKTLVDVFGRSRVVEGLRPADFEELRNRLAGSRTATTLHNENPIDKADQTAGVVRAVTWCKHAHPLLTGLLKTKVDKRLSEIERLKLLPANINIGKVVPIKPPVTTTLPKTEERTLRVLC